MAYLSRMARTSGTYRYLLHLLLWMMVICLYTFPMLQSNWGSAFGLRYTLIRYGLYGFINFQLFYLLAFYVLPAHDRRKHLYAAGGTVAVVLVFSLIKYGVALIFADEVLQGAVAMIGFPKTYFSFGTYFRFTLATGIAVAFAAYAYYIFLEWRARDKASYQLEVETAAVQRRYTQMQFSSQLLLRKLKALESMLADEQKRDGEGAETILQLSQLLRYMLYDKAVRFDKAPLGTELHYFHLYLQLHNRLFPRQAVSVQVNKSAQGHYITPFQLQAAAEQILENQEAEAPVVLRINIGTDTLALSSGPGPGRLQKLLTRLRYYQHINHLTMPLYASPA